MTAQDRRPVVDESRRRTPRTSRPVMRQVADRAGVAVSSVSRVLSGHPEVSSVMRTRVLDAVAALGYHPDMLAQSLRTGATLTIGFVVGDNSNPLIAQIALGAELTLRAANYSILMLNSMNDAELEVKHLRLLEQRRVDGMLLSLADETNAQTIAALHEARCPVVLIDRVVKDLEGASEVLSDHGSGLTAAVEHLLSLGHRHIALVNGNPRVWPTRNRASAMRAAMRRRSGTTATIRAGSFTADHGYRATMELLTGPQPPSAIIAGGNQILVGVLRAIVQLGVDVPTELSLVTCDDVPLSEFLRPPLATISRDPEELGRVGASLLLELLTDGPARRVHVPTGFRPTESCGPPPARARRTRKASS